MKRLFTFILIVFCSVLQAGNGSKSASLAEMLGYSKSGKLLIINADDAGMSHATNLGVLKAMKEGLVSSATIMVPCPWFSEIADIAVKNPDLDFGVHLTHTSEWKYYRWGPLTSSEKTPGLRGRDGFFYRDVKSLYRNSNPTEAYTEAKAQIDKAIKAGIKITHIDSHMGAMMYDYQYALMYIRLAKEYNLPLRIPSLETLKKHKAEKLIGGLDALGLLYPDYLVYGGNIPKGRTQKQTWLTILRNLKPGVTEIFIHPALPSPETKGITHSWKKRAEELRLFTSDEDIKKAITDNNIKIISYHKLLDLQRSKNRPIRTH